jgi:hypothetical protein
LFPTVCFYFLLFVMNLSISKCNLEPCMVPLLFNIVFSIFSVSIMCGQIFCLFNVSLLRYDRTKKGHTQKHKKQAKSIEIWQCFCLFVLFVHSSNFLFGSFWSIR